MMDWPDDPEEIGLVIRQGTKQYHGERIDGYIELHNLPARRENEQFRAGVFPYRAEKRGGRMLDTTPADEDAINPIWRWENPDDPPNELTITPSIGVGAPDDDADEDEWQLRVYIHKGEIVVP